LTTTSSPAVAILAGGHSRRMGRDKTRLSLGTTSLIGRVAAAAAPLGAPCMLIAGDAAPFADLHLPVHADLRPGLGPLGGLHTALSLAPGDPVLLLASDLPFITADFLRFLLQETGSHQVLVPRGADGLHPLCAVYARSCLPAVERALDRGELQMVAFFPEVDAHVLPYHRWQRFDPHRLLLTNLNTPEDYRRAQALVEGEPRP
jgi:molybdopterin-guanine dinucleotide biosynthesis protein A